MADGRARTDAGTLDYAERCAIAASLIGGPRQWCQDEGIELAALLDLATRYGDAPTAKPRSAFLFGFAVGFYAGQDAPR